MKEDFKKILDHKYILRNTDTRGLKVTIKSHPKKRVGLFATKHIKKNNVIAYYRMTVYKIDGFKSQTKNMYTFTVLTPKGNPSRTLIGDLSLESLPPPCRNIPYWAYFSNEPSFDEDDNAYIDMNTEEIYRTRKKLNPGDTITYKLRASRNIKKGEEILWCYGDSYDRDYLTPCT